MPQSVATSAPTLAPTSSTPATPTPTLPTPTPTPVPTAAPTPLPTLVPTAATPPELAAAVDAAMQRAMQLNATPGGVALVRHRGVRIFHKAYGLSRKYETASDLAADPIPATTETLYDLASITKLFTTTAAIRLVEQGRLALDEPIAQWLPDFAEGGKQDVTLRQLLTHTSGLPADLELWKLESTPSARIQRVLVTPLLNPPGKVFRYSDLGLITVGHLLEQVVGTTLERVVRDLVIEPLRLDQVVYRPPAELKRRIAATEYQTDPERGLIWGEVHDPTAWSLGGVAGHAGLFGTADQLDRFAQLFLNNGGLDGARLLSAQTVADMTRNQIESIDYRGLGWELKASYYMGRLASPQTYGHTGFTGTSLVIDPRRELVVIVLTNRVHPIVTGPSINPLRQAVANAAMAAADAT
jgi:serine-type D-Ala-D-Ala carboxypeptidase